MKPLVLAVGLMAAFCSGLDTSNLKAPYFAHGQVPVWSPVYSVAGSLSIPFAEITEPFEAFFDAEAGKSRIDYYGGMDKTFQLAKKGPYGAMYKVVPMTDENVVNQINCFVVDGSADEPVAVQPILPDLAGFELKGDDNWAGEKCQKWQKETVVGDKVNKYTMWVKAIELEVEPGVAVAVPVHYEMRGFNTLLGSHYDHYFLDYSDYLPEKPADSAFDIPAGLTCHGWPGPGLADHSITMNPAQEFVQGRGDHVDAAFAAFEAKHGRSYRDGGDRDSRKDVFRQNLRFIHSTNRKNLSFRVAPNHLADRTDTEVARMRGRLRSTGYNGGQPFSYTAGELADAPETLDWRLYGAVTPVKDQSSCGSCWSFGTVGTLEGASFLKTGRLVRFSQQALIDCSWGFGNNGCDGGEDFRVYRYMLEHGGIPTEASYGPYLGNDGFCHANDSGVEVGFQIASYANVTSGDADAVRVAMAKHGPLSVGIDASHKSLSFYSHGVYYEPDCDSSPDGLDHAVLAVGYGSVGGHKYWLVKNSWSTYWGNDGYVLMSQRDNNCGVATAATFVHPKA